MAKDLKPKKKDEVKPQYSKTYVVVPPDGGWGWVIVAAAFACNFVAEGTMYSYGLFLEDIAKNLNTRTTNVSLANSLMTGPLICAMINRWGYRIVAFTGGVLAALAFIASSFAPNIGILILTYGLLGGIGFGMLYMPSVIAIGFYFEKWRGVANSVSLCGSAVGSITIPIIISVSMKELIWRNKFRCFSGFTLFCAMCTLLYKPLQPLEIRIDQPPENVSDDESDDDIFPYKSVKNKLNNQTFQKMSTQASIYSIRRAGSPNAMSAFSFKSYASTTRSVFKGSRMSHDSEEGWFATCCNCENFKHTFKLLCCCCQRCGANPARPMYRDDILYAGSVANLKEYNDKSIMDPMDYHISMTRVASEKDLREDLKCCTICPTTVRRPLATMLDFGLFKSTAFTLLAISGFLSMLGFFIPLMYITAKNIDHGMDKVTAAYLLSCFGFANLVGRIACAIINFFPSIKSLPLTVAFVLFAGSSVVASVFFIQVPAQFAFCAVYGVSFESFLVFRSHTCQLFVTAMIFSLKPILIVELFGIEKLSNSFGILMMFYGMACLLGIPIGGLMHDMTNSYIVSFLFAGVSIILSGLLLSSVPSILHKEKKRAHRRRRKLEQLKSQAAHSSKHAADASTAPTQTN
ncbi:monocarboxylate transporter [Holotrichia oblita]|uniref:Monocarboxylate transporter n=1 Tax=Holotrichia oblita TaxID=644536 RepID=A0ACB9ST66_HOLOL|nr:monocarboxylate transporter [Holotrichia oblita]